VKEIIDPSFLGNHFFAIFVDGNG